MLEILDKLGTPALIIGAAVLVWERIARLQADVLANTKHIETTESRLSHLEGRYQALLRHNGI